ncbi:hypothetical protein BD410DRAFT_787614 [Rickenella mellea]|uniref:Zn(2)-C6 fungal-type domain-containing protein n=1 Tax=Rickenella mellea TaxID=50990 RepID=A0A4Y7Q8T1_9AGAM|nr:hypothetical protein BD410DRAFT_787614 [Rickenella mellea]
MSTISSPYTANFDSFLTSPPLMQDDPNCHPAITQSDVPKVSMKNHKPCANCQYSHVKCDISEPYSADRCKKCTNDGISSCPASGPRPKRVWKEEKPYSRPPPSKFDKQYDFGEGSSAGILAATVGGMRRTVGGLAREAWSGWHPIRL